jgi:hypothetical protein
LAEGRVGSVVDRIVANRSRILRWMWIPQLVVGAFLLVLAVYIGRGHFDLIRHGMRADGRVVGYEQRTFRSSNGTSQTSTTTTAFMPIVEFRTSARVVRFTDWLGSRSAGHLSEVLTVLYDPTNPSLAMIDRPVMNWIPWMPIAAVGLLLVVAAFRAGARRASSG